MDDSGKERQQQRQRCQKRGPKEWAKRVGVASPHHTDLPRAKWRSLCDGPAPSLRLPPTSAARHNVVDADRLANRQAGARCSFGGQVGTRVLAGHAVAARGSKARAEGRGGRGGGGG